MAWAKAVYTFVVTYWTYIKVVAAAIYVYQLWRQKKKAENQSPTYGLEITTQCSNELPIPIIYGMVKAGGNIIWQYTSGDQKHMYVFVAFSEGPIEGFEDVRVNDIPIGDLPGCSYTPYLGTSTQTVDPRCIIDEITLYDDPNYKKNPKTLIWGRYSATDLEAEGFNVRRILGDVWTYQDVESIKTNGLRVTIYEGPNFDGQSWTYTSDNPHIDCKMRSLEIEAPSYNSGLRRVGGLRNVAYIAFTLKASEKLSGGMPNFTAVVKGRKVRVWENDAWVTKWTEYMPWHLLDLLTHTRYGGGYTDDQIDIESFRIAAAYCAETLSDGQPRFTEGIIIDWIEALPDIVTMMRLTSRAYVVNNNGKLALKIEKPEPVSQYFSMDEIVPKSLELYIPGKDEIFDKVTVTYCEPNQNWAKLPAQSIDESNPINPVKDDMVIIGVNRFNQASRLAYFYRVYSKYCKISGKFKTTIRALNRTPGDVIALTDDIMGWVEKPVRITEIRHSGDHIHEIHFREYNETIYNDALGSAEPTLNYSELPNPFSPLNNPTDLVLTENTYVLSTGEIVPEIIVTFNPAYSVFYRYSLVQISDNGTVWRDYCQTYEGSCLIHNIRIGAKYWIRVKTVSSQVVSDGVVATITMSGKDRPPSDVPKLIIRQIDGQLKAIVTPSDDPDIKFHRLRMGWNWDNSILIKEFEGTEYVFTAPKEGTLTFWVKAVDYSNGESQNATKAICTVFGLKPINIIYEQTMDLKNCTVQNMYLDIWGRWRIQGVKTLEEFEYFSDLFEGPLQLRPNPQLTFPEIDLGPNILEEGCFYIDMWGAFHLKSIETPYDFEYFSDIFDTYYGTGLTLVNPKYATQTLLGVDVSYNTNVNNRVDIDYCTRVDGDGWSEWTPYTERQFLGRRIKPRLTPISIDSTTDVIISAVKVVVDVPDVEDIPVENLQIPAARTRIYYKRKFFNIPKSVTASTTDLNGVSATNRIDPEWITRDYFDIEILDSNGNLIPGIIQIAKVRGG